MPKEPASARDGVLSAMFSLCYILVMILISEQSPVARSQRLGGSTGAVSCDQGGTGRVCRLLIAMNRIGLSYITCAFTSFFGAALPLNGGV